MNLSKRASVLILPVILLSYALAALLVYEQQKTSIVEIEQNKLELRLSILQAEFTSYDNFIGAYLVSLVEGEALTRFIRNPNNIYNERAITLHLESAVSRFFNNRAEFASISMLSPQGEPLLYVENSTDPFASMRSEQQVLAKKMREEGLIKLWEHKAQSTSVIQQGLLLDSRTIADPHKGQLQHALQLIVSATPASFDKLLSEIITEFSAETELTSILTSAQTSEQQLVAYSELKQGYYLTVHSSPEYLKGLFAALRDRLILIVCIGAMLTFLLLQLLIRKYITSPIFLLDKQLKQVMDSNRSNIDPPDSADEIGRLGRKFHSLYQQLHKAFRETHTQSRTDALTRLPNRTAFYEIATKQLAEAEKESSTVNIVYIDLDNFKFVNDKFGHEVGDELLKTVASRLKHIVTHCMEEETRHSANVFRLSGDEFIVMLPGLKTEQASQLCQKILNLFTDGYHFELGNFPVTASVGIATFPKDGHSLSQLISNADLAMYQAKNSGKNKQSVYSKELAKKDRQIKEIESHLKRPEFTHELSLFYMPIFDRQGKVKGCEALLRWTTEDIGAVSPALFIPIAESIGMFETIDTWVARQAFKDFPLLQNTFGPQFELSINISSAEMGSSRFVDTLEVLSTEASIQTRNVVIEITETFALDKSQDALQWLGKLRKLGFQIAIDDFGTGYTSLMQMVDYPVDTIKFDKELTERLTQAEKHNLASALIDLCHLQGLKVVAEGIESQQQYKLLNAAGCDYQQGFHMAMPQSLQDILENYASNYSEYKKN